MKLRELVIVAIRLMAVWCIASLAVELFRSVDSITRSGLWSVFFESVPFFLFAILIGLIVPILLWFGASKIADLAISRVSDNAKITSAIDGPTLLYTGIVLIGVGLLANSFLSLAQVIANLSVSPGSEGADFQFRSMYDLGLRQAALSLLFQVIVGIGLIRFAPIVSSRLAQQ